MAAPEQAILSPIRESLPPLLAPNLHFLHTHLQRESWFRISHHLSISISTAFPRRSIISHCTITNNKSPFFTTSFSPFITTYPHNHRGARRLPPVINTHKSNTLIPGNYVLLLRERAHCSLNIFSSFAERGRGSLYPQASEKLVRTRTGSSLPLFIVLIE